MSKKWSLVLVAVLGLAVALAVLSAVQQELNTLDEEVKQEPGSVFIVDRSKRFASMITLPVPGSVPDVDTYHTVSLQEIKQGCFRQDCIPSVDNPEFAAAANLSVPLDLESLGIALSYKDTNRFYPFPMLETRELVNDVVAGDPLLISYCPLCGTGIVFDRTVGDEVMEFGVSGMLWNSNLLMYNRAVDHIDRNLWSQVLGEAVVGDLAGTELTVVPSEIMRYKDWLQAFPAGSILDTGSVADPYNGQYYAIASQFNPNFDRSSSSLAPDEYVYGLLVKGSPLAVTRPVVATQAELQFNKSLVTFTKSESGEIQFYVDGEEIADKEGFWFSFKAAYPNAVVWDDATINSI